MMALTKVGLLEPTSGVASPVFMTGPEVARFGLEYHKSIFWAMDRG